ncbi:MAG: hypothetical protein Q8876_02830 [Bacillota bacterium]|nr:hypothetical protein [Bacillota bacterium]
MKNNIRKLGFWSSAISFIISIAYIICFVCNYSGNSSFTWTNSVDFINYANTHSEIFKYIAMALMPILSFCFLIQLECLRETVDSEKHFFVSTATHFAIGFSVLVGINYFVQISAIRLQVASNKAEAVSQFVQANPISFISAVNMLGWTVFFGIACIFASLAMKNERKERSIKYSFLINGIMMLTSSIAYTFNITIILAIFMFIGLGAALIIESISLCLYFSRIQLLQKQ